MDWHIFVDRVAETRRELEMMSKCSTVTVLAAAGLLTVAAVPLRAQERQRFVPYDTPPLLANREETASVIAAELRKSAVSANGDASVYVHVSEEGSVDSARVHRSPGGAALDKILLRVARHMHFRPAMQHGAPIAVWTAVAVRVCSDAAGRCPQDGSWQVLIGAAQASGSPPAGGVAGGGGELTLPGSGAAS